MGTVPDVLDDLAVTFAGETLLGAGGPYSVSNIRSAMAAAGFDQVDPAGVVFWPGEAPGQGIAFEEADAELIALGVAEGVRISLDDLLAGWATVSPSLTADLLRPRLVADLRAAAASTSPTRRFWAHYVVQLGRNADAPYDLLDPAVPGASLLDPVQVAFLAYRYQADLWLAGRRAGGLLRVAGSTLGAGARATGPRPCTMTDTEQTVLDTSATAVSSFMGGLVDYVGESVPAASKASSLVSGANAALTVTKFLWVLAAFDAKVTATPSRLTRHHDGTAGDGADLTAAFRYTTGNWQVVNCVRPALNALGIDFSLPQDGPIAGARVDWEMFAVKERNGATPILRYVEGYSPLRRTTNESGEDTIKVEGTPRSPPLTAPVRPDYRLVKFHAKVALKDTRLYQDLLDAVGTAMAGNPAMMALSMIFETLQRMNSVVFAGRHALPVKDWRPLAGAVVHVQMAGTLSGAIRPDGTGTESAIVAADLWKDPAPGAEPLQLVFFPGYPAMGTVDLRENGYRELSYQGSGDWTGACPCVPGTFQEQSREDYSAVTVADADPETLMVTVQEDGSFTFDLPLRDTWGAGRRRLFSEGCGAPPQWVDERLAVSSDLGTVTITGTIDTRLPSGTIEGSFSAPHPLTVPQPLGGFYSGGVADPDVDATVIVDYVLSYTLLRPLGAPPPGIAAAAAEPSAPRERIPAYTSWPARVTPAYMACE